MELVFRDPTTISRIPNYEGQPMIQTLLEQVRAAGAVPVNGTGAASEQAQSILMLVNNFSEQQQLEAPNQPMNRNVTEFSKLTPYVTLAVEAGSVVGFADNRYSNGADNIFVDYMATLPSSTGLSMQVCVPQHRFVRPRTDSAHNRISCMQNAGLCLRGLEH